MKYPEKANLGRQKANQLLPRGGNQDELQIGCWEFCRW